MLGYVTYAPNEDVGYDLARQARISLFWTASAFVMVYLIGSREHKRRKRNRVQKIELAITSPQPQEEGEQPPTEQQQEQFDQKEQQQHQEH